MKQTADAGDFLDLVLFRDWLFLDKLFLDDFIVEWEASIYKLILYRNLYWVNNLSLKPGFLWV